MEQSVRNAPAQQGFRLPDDGQAGVIEKTKSIITEAIHSREAAHVNFSLLVARQTGLDYSSLSALFSSMEGLTIEKHITLQRVERAKELIVYDQLSLSQTAFQLGFGSVRHLSNAFKKATGLTPSCFKKLRPRKSLYGKVDAR